MLSRPNGLCCCRGRIEGEQCRRSTKDDHYNMQSTQKSFPLQCTVERLLGSAIKKSLSPSPDTTMGDCLQLSPWHQSCFKNVFHSPSAIPLHAWTPKPCGAVQFWSSAEKDVGMGKSNCETFPSRRRDRAVPQSWNMSSLFKSVKIFEPWFHVIETWVSYRIWRISNPKQLAHIIQHLILQGSFSFMQVVQRKQFYHLILWQPEKYLLRFTPTLYNLATCNFADKLCTNCQGVVEVLSRMLSNERRSGPPPLSLSLRARARVFVVMYSFRQV